MARISDLLSWPQILSALLAGEDLPIASADWAMGEVMSGDASGAQVAGFLVALEAKGVSVDEIVGFRDAILASATPLPIDPMALDIVGTGGDKVGTVNVSTMSSVVAAATDVPVLKHGNRSVSSKSGASDVLAALGIDLSLSPEAIARVFSEVGIGFAFAPGFHPGFRHAAPVRAELGVPTVFNYLGPLCNPARPEASAMGVARRDLIPVIVGLFQTRGATALVLRGDDGLDELTTTGHSHVWEVSRGRVTEHDLDPRDLGIPRAQLSDLLGGNAEHNAAIARRVFAGERGPVRDIVLLNTAAGIVSYDLARDAGLLQTPILERLADGIRRAEEALDSGAAAGLLERWVAATHAA